MTSPSARVRESAEFVCVRAEHVFLQEAGLDRSADLIAEQLLSVPRSQSGPPPGDPDPRGTEGNTDPRGTEGNMDPRGTEGNMDPRGTEGNTDPRGTEGNTDPRGTEGERAGWILVRDAINFCFFGPAGPYRVAYRGRGYAGYAALCAALSWAADQGVPFFSPSFLAKVSDAELGGLLRGEEGDIPLLRERGQILREVGAALCRSGRSFLEMVRSCDGSSQRLVSMVLDTFPSFRDEATSAHEPARTVCFYKRAQILAADLWDHFGGAGPGRFGDIGDLTMFADYRVPQVLYSLGALAYSAELLLLVRAGDPLPTGGKMEQELRAASVRAVELLRGRVRGRLGEEGLERARGNGWEVNAVSLDFFLWDFGKRERDRVDASVPHHRTISTFY